MLKRIAAVALLVLLPPLGASAQVKIGLMVSATGPTSTCSGRPRPVSCLPTMAAARAERTTRHRDNGGYPMNDYRLNISRRRWIKSAGALAGVAAIGGWAPAHAQSGGRIVLGTWGGDYSKLLAKNIDTPLMVPKKYDVVHDIGGDPERRAKMRAEARLPRGTDDLQGLSAAQMFEMNEAGLCLPIDYAK